MKQIAFVICLICLSSQAFDVSISVKHEKREANGFMISVPGMKDRHFVLTVAHLVNHPFAADSIKIKDVDARVVAVCKEYDLCLLEADVPWRTLVEVPEPGISLDQKALKLYSTKEPKIFPARIDYVYDDWLWVIKSHYEIGFSGSAVLINDGNFLAGMACQGFVSSPGKIKDGQGLIVPVSIIRKFLEAAKSRMDGCEIVYVSKHSIDHWKQGRAPVIFETKPCTPIELRPK